VPPLRAPLSPKIVAWGRRLDGHNSSSHQLNGQLGMIATGSSSKYGILASPSSPNIRDVAGGEQL